MSLRIFCPSFQPGQIQLPTALPKQILCLQISMYHLVTDQKKGKKMDAVQTDDFREIIRDTFPAGSLKKRVWAPCKNGGRLGKYVFFLFVLGNLSIFRGRTVKLPGE